MGRPISDKYKRRITAVRGQTAALRQEVKQIMVEELLNATNEELYQRTPLPVTFAMWRSIRSVVRGQDVFALFDGRIAKHAKYRVNMHGISVLGGHVLDMRPALYLRQHADPRIRRAVRAAHKRMLEGK
jgi:hypothetical protein